MKRATYTIALFTMFLISCDKKQDKQQDKQNPSIEISTNQKVDINAFDASENLTTEEADTLKLKMIRYIGKLPKKANHITKYEQEHDAYYTELANNHSFLFYYKSSTSDTTYFAITRRAPSLYDKHVSIGGKFINNDSTFTYFEENFRSFKMFKEELSEKTAMLFQDMINERKLKKYYFRNTQPEEIIEFPDEYTSYSPEKLMWVSKREIY